MSSVSFTVNRKEMLDAYEAILDDNNPMNWALYSYKANNELYLESTGENGLEELEDEFNSGKLQYAFVRILDPNTKMKKYLLLIWQGEGVPATRKGACANHVRDVKRFFKAHHMTLFARNDDDVTADEIMRQVTKTTSNFTFIQPTNQDVDTQAANKVGSVYKPIRPIEEIKKVKNDSFWEKVQAEEESRKREEAKRAAERRKIEELRLKEEQIRSDANRKKIEREREADISAKLKAQKLADDRSAEAQAEKLAWEENMREQERAMEEQRRSRRTSSVEHTQEAQYMITKRESNPRDMWAQRERQQREEKPFRKEEPPVRKLSSNFTNRFQQQQATPEPSVSEATEEVEDNAFVVEQPPQAVPEPKEQAPPQDNSYQGETYEEPLQTDYQPDETYAQYQPQEQDNNGYNEQQAQEEPQYYDDTQQPQSDCQVRALYDYQAVDDTEISFDPGDVITQVEQIDEGWWRGVGPRGDYGLFPANYVELI